MNLKSMCDTVHPGQLDAHVKAAAALAHEVKRRSAGDGFLPNGVPYTPRPALIGDDGAAVLAAIESWSTAVRNGTGDVVPVALIRPRELPPATSVTYHAAAHLNRVVEAIHDDVDEAHGRSPAWAHGDEPKSMAMWRRLAGALACRAGDHSLRCKRLDMESYAVEVEQVHVQIRDFQTTFQDFMDALVDDYERWTRIRKPPLFVVAFVETHFAPAWDGKIAEALAVLRHPRLLFVLS